jgi:hypothetical protein
LLALDQVSKRILIAVLKLFRLEVTGHCLDDVAREFKHLLRRVFLWNLVEVALRFSHLVGVVKQQADNAPVSGFEGDHMFACGQHDAAKGHHAALHNCLADQRKGLLPDLAVRYDVIGTVDVTVVDFVSEHDTN